MNDNQLKKRVWLTLSVAVLLTALGTFTNLLWPTLLPKAGPTLPPRPGPASPSDDDDDDSGSTKRDTGAYIELISSPALSGGWSSVEWQDSDGNWQKVDGWQGSLDGQGGRRWYVASKDFGDGPFRWVVNQGTGGTVVGTSATFNLPTEPFETLFVTISQ